MEDVLKGPGWVGAVEAEWAVAAVRVEAVEWLEGIPG